MGETAGSGEKTAKSSRFKGIKAEFKKIIWPDRDTLIKQSAAVVVITAILAILISLVDMALKFGLDKILLLG